MSENVVVVDKLVQLRKVGAVVFVKWSQAAR